ncbi:MAG: hypothetical protein WBN40_14170, partial [Pseudomonadales bacterium]
MHNPHTKAAPAHKPATRPRSLWAEAWQRLAQNRLATAGLLFLLLLVVLAMLAPLLTHYSYAQQNLALGATPPSAAHWLGT